MHNQSGSLAKVVLPIALEWYITGSCNLKCQYCRDRVEGYEPRPYSEFVRKVIKLAPKHIWLGGGEPAMVRELPQILKTIKSELNVSIGLSTNLTMFKTIIESLPFIDDLIVSLDTADDEMCRKYRCVSPEDIVGNIDRLCRSKLEKGLNTNISVNSVVYKDSLKRGGLEKLSDMLFAVDPGIWHIFCPLYPESQEGSIVKDSESAREFFAVIERLKKAGRRIMMDFPLGENKKSFNVDNVKCYRRFFRVQMSEDGEIYSPCPDSSPDEPSCKTPCNCAGFIDDILSVKDPAALDGSPVRHRFSPVETDTLFEFIKSFIDPGISKERLAGLSGSGRRT